MQVSAEVKSFSVPKSGALSSRKSFETEDNLNEALKHCFLLQGAEQLHDSTAPHARIPQAIASYMHTPCYSTVHAWCT